MKKIEKINISDFQIWDEVEIILKDFNVIKGSSNSGKSAIVRAINMVINNDWHKSWLRKDQSNAKVKITFDDGTYIERTRGGINSVSIKSKHGELESWSGFGSSYPQRVMEFLNLGEENCSYQFDSHFFLSLTPTKRALTLGTFSDLQKIDSILIDVQKNIRDNDNLIKALELNLQNGNEELVKARNILRAENAVRILVEANDLNLKLQQLFDIKEQLDAINLELENYDHLELLTSVTSELEAMYSMLDLFEIDGEISSIEREISKLNLEIKPEEICPTCGQLVEESHEKA